MKYSSAIASVTYLWATAQAGVINDRQTTAGAGTGPYPASYTTDSGLTGQTIFLPNNPPAGTKLPVMLWGVGGCSDSGSSIAGFHNEIASHGYVVIVNNAPTTKATTQATSLTAAADWVEKVAGTSGKWATVDKTRIVVSGWSCGGLQAYTVDQDKRWSSIGIFSSGQFAEADSKAVGSKVDKPIFYFLGGSTDIAYANGERDWKYLPTTLPAWKGNLDVGHFGTYSQPNGGKFAQAAVHWLDWVLKGNTTAATFFTGDGAKADGWSVASQNLASLKVTPISK